MSQVFLICIQVPIAWGDMDAFGHVNNTVYFRLFEDARIRFFEEVGIDHRAPGGGCAPILASTQCQFRFPMSYPDTARVESGIVQIGRSSFTMRYLVHSVRHDRLAAEGDGVWCGTTTRRRRARPCPTSCARASSACAWPEPSGRREPAAPA